MIAKLLLQNLIWFGGMGALLFVTAGTLHWPVAWIFLLIFFSAATGTTLMLIRHDPALLEERMKPLVQEGQPLWDRIIMPVFVVVFCVWLALMGLDAVRFGWSSMPLWLEILGQAGVALAMWICYQAFLVNTFLAPVVKIQSERGHQVVSSGPYAIVRHPLYAGALLLFPSTAFALGSWYGLAMACVLIAGLVARTVLEDRELHRHLDGYAAYARKVRYRLVPFVW